MSARRFPRADLPVSISSWEIECCGPLPRVGQPSTWRLTFMPVDAADMDPQQFVSGLITELQWQVEPLPDGTYGRALHRNGFAVYFIHSDWASGGQNWPLPAIGRQSLRGSIFGTRHGGAEHDSFNSVTATVGRVQVISWDHRAKERGLVRLPGSIQLRDVPQSPQWFTRSPRTYPKTDQKSEGTGMAWSNPGVVDGASYRDETGLLLTLVDETGMTPGSEQPPLS